MVRLSNNQVILVGSQPGHFCIGMRVILPIKKRTVVRMEEHKHLRQFSIPVKDGLRRIPSDVQQPAEILHHKKRNIHIYSTIFRHQGYSVEIGFHWGEYLYFTGLGDVVDSFNRLLSDVTLDVGVVDHSDLKSDLFRVFSNILDA